MLQIVILVSSYNAINIAFPSQANAGIFNIIMPYELIWAKSEYSAQSKA